MGLAISSAREQTDCTGSVGRYPVIGRLQEYSQVLSDGWRHLNFVICTKDRSPNDTLNKNWVRTKLEAIRDQITTLKTKSPDRIFFITFKGYRYLRGWEDGSSETILYQRK
jgi:hypothetical protein